MAVCGRVGDGRETLWSPLAPPPLWSPPLVCGRGYDGPLRCSTVLRGSAGSAVRSVIEWSSERGAGAPRAPRALVDVFVEWPCVGAGLWPLRALVDDCPSYGGPRWRPGDGR